MYHHTDRNLTDDALRSLPDAYKRALKRFLETHDDNIKIIRCNMSNINPDGCVISGGFQIYVTGNGYDDEMSEYDSDILIDDKLGIKDLMSSSSLFSITYSDYMDLGVFSDMTSKMNDYSIEGLEDLLNA